MTNIERYARIITDNIEFSQSLEPLDVMHPSVPKPTEWHNAASVARAVIEAFVSDAINEICLNCRNGREATRPSNREWQHGHGVSCTARHLRESSRRLLENG